MSIPTCWVCGNDDRAHAMLEVVKRVVSATEPTGMSPAMTKAHALCCAVIRIAEMDDDWDEWVGFTKYLEEDTADDLR